MDIRFPFYSPTYNFFTKVHIEEKKNNPKITRFQLLKINPFDLFGSTPLGVISGFFRLTLAIVDLYRLYHWQPNLTPNDMEVFFPSNKEPTVEEKRKNSLKRLEQTNEQRSKEIEKNTEERSKANEVNKAEMIKEIKAALRKVILLNIGKSIPEMFLVVGQICTLVYNINLYGQQKQKIFESFRKDIDLLNASKSKNTDQMNHKVNGPQTLQMISDDSEDYTNFGSDNFLKKTIMKQFKFIDEMVDGPGLRLIYVDGQFKKVDKYNSLSVMQKANDLFG